MTHEPDWTRILLEWGRITRICHQVARPWGDNVDPEGLITDVALELAQRPPSQCISDDMLMRMASRHAYRWAGWR